MLLSYWTTFAELLAKPFESMPLIWGIVPLYFALALNELTSAKANFRTALQTGFSFLWAAAQWVYPHWHRESVSTAGVHLPSMTPVHLAVSGLVIVLGVLALWSGVVGKYPKGCAFLGHTRFSNYFMITIFPMQAHRLDWTWDRLIAILIFALPLWAVLHFGFMPFRK